jgi:hypothetical protein
MDEAALTMENRLRKYLQRAQSGAPRDLLNLMMACASCPAAAEVVAGEERKRVGPKHAVAEALDAEATRRDAY